ncbi:MAG: 30S ribosomal protein S3, partial [Acidobacteria bacterium]|nr:30S ribosomal protein S3 [Acidobacteriota bacterium]
MGQKVHPYGFRLGYNRTWHSRWFASKKSEFGKQLLEDLMLKKELKLRLGSGGGRESSASGSNTSAPTVSQIEIDRAADRLRVIIYTSRVGQIVGRKKAELDKLRVELSRRTKKEVLIDVREIAKPELNAQLQAEKIAQQLEKRVAFRRAMRKAVDETLRYGAQGGSSPALGIKVRVSGRLNGAEIARSEWTLQGRLPLHTLRADIDYGFAEAHTTFGV